VYRYRLSGPPYEGLGQLSILERVEAETAWKMLDNDANATLDAVALYMLFLAYAGDTTRRGRPEEPFRIPREKVFHVLGMHRDKNTSLKEKVRRVHKLNSYLNSFRVQLTRVTHNGDRVRTDAISPAQLWDTYLRGTGETDLFGNRQWADFWIEGREGAWASEFLHGERGGRQWTGLPIRILEDIDRRNEWTRRILFHALIQFRVNRGGFVRKAATLTQWCREDFSAIASRYTLRRRKNKLRNALRELEEHGLRVDASRLGTDGRDLDAWLSARVHFEPPADMVEASRFIGGGKVLKPRTDVWTGRRIKALRSRLGETQGVFGKRLGVKQPRVSLLEKHGDATPEQEAALNQIAENVDFRE
jgi:DNA-binding XRE family transcriptional regulator